MTDGTVSERLPFGNYWVDGLGHLFDVHRVSRVGVLVLMSNALRLNLVTASLSLLSLSLCVALAMS
jgi:hypothetical protein